MNSYHNDQLDRGAACAMHGNDETLLDPLETDAD